MSSKNGEIPIYAADGRSLGFRTLAAARKLVAGGHVKAAYGPRKQLKAIFLRQEDGSNPIETHPRVGTRYSFLQHLDSGHHCWRHERLDGRDEDGAVMSARGAFLEVVRERLR